MTTQATRRDVPSILGARGDQTGSVGLAVLASIATIAVAIVAGVLLGRAVAPDSVLGDWRTAFEERETLPGDSGGTDTGDAARDDDPFAMGDADTYGDDPELDALWDACDAGDGDACDTLFLRSPFGSEYERFGQSCGGREGDDYFGVCGDGGAFALPQGYGDDPELDALWDACEAGDLTACDDLFWSSMVDSEYEEFGATCGERTEAGFGDCEERAG